MLYEEGSISYAVESSLSNNGSCFKGSTLVSPPFESREIRRRQSVRLTKEANSELLILMLNKARYLRKGALVTSDETSATETNMIS